MKKGRRAALTVWAAAAALCLAGCSAAGAYGRELEDTVLVEVIGVDAWEEGVTLTAAGMDGEEGTALVQVCAPALEEAFAALPTAGEKYLSLTNVSHVIVGDGVDLFGTLEYVLHDRDMSYMAQVWAAGGGFAGALMEQTEDGGAGRFAVLKQSGVEQVTVKGALAALLAGEAVGLPALEMWEGRLEPVGMLSFEVSG